MTEAPVSRSPRPRAIDGAGARIAALAIAAGLAGAMVWIGKVGFAGVAMTPFESSGTVSAGMTSSGNPQLDACLAERVGAVDKMREEGLVDAARYDTFRSRAVSYCESQFPAQ
ncbi:hypothetical protein [Stappia indica]|uniref:Uncharacterized protein n=1 Tax=Stappia indica TaxID=538381 RepID=A0A285S9Q6_9HYPH|nr:hypothetical protein [Stappia indica]SOC04197.1 hypothetical protein SAMN05421512_104340 [Stappia indica]